MYSEDEHEITCCDGPVGIEGASPSMRLVERDGFLAAEIDDDTATLTADQVRGVMEHLRAGPSGQ
jgi:hypothetical protein